MQNVNDIIINLMLFMRIGFADISVVFHNCKLNGNYK